MDLLHPVGARQRGEDRLVEPREEELQPAVGREPAELVEVARLVGLEPLEQRAGKMEDGGKELALGEPLQQRAVDVLHVLAEDVVEVPDRLVEMETEDEPERVRRLTRRGHRAADRATARR